MCQDIQLEEYYPKNKKENGNLLHFYQEQYNQLKEITRYTTKNYWKLLQSGDNIY